LWNPEDKFTPAALRQEAGDLFRQLADADTLTEAHRVLHAWLERRDVEPPDPQQGLAPNDMIRRRDCILALHSIGRASSDALAGFSTTEALWDLARGKARPDLSPGFFADLINLFKGIEGHCAIKMIEFSPIPLDIPAEQASQQRSEQLDRLWQHVEKIMDRYQDGLEPESVARRGERRGKILKVLGGTPENWNNWKWQTQHVLRTAEQIERVVSIEEQQATAIRRANQNRIPVGITPYYASLMDEQAGPRDAAVRAQVLPPPSYIEAMIEHRENREVFFDFMGEHYTSPVELVTRRYPAVCILKPYNSCPQICVYCQRNWEIEQPLAPGSLAPQSKIDAAVDWIAAHPAIREVLITGGDPLVMSDERLRSLLDKLSAIERIDLIRIGSRVPVTLPMRITQSLADLLGSYRLPGRRELCLMTHVEHPYEITPEMVAAIDRLRRRGISAYNQQVYTFFVSRRFESTRLRMLLRRIGIDPYYTFVAKGEEEMAAYRVPMARLLQEQKEESRLLPGTRRTDAVVYNVPRLGKNHLRALQHRSLLAIAPDGARIYEFHPWEKNIVERKSFVDADVPILTYLNRLAASGEDPNDYATIWYYF